MYIVKQASEQSLYLSVFAKLHSVSATFNLGGFRYYSPHLMLVLTRRRERECEQPRDEARDARLALGPDDARLQRQADGVVALHRDGQDRQHRRVRHRQLHERHQVAHHLEQEQKEGRGRVS